MHLLLDSLIPRLLLLLHSYTDCYIKTESSHTSNIGGLVSAGSVVSANSGYSVVSHALLNTSWQSWHYLALLGS